MTEPWHHRTAGAACPACLPACHPPQQSRRPMHQCASFPAAHKEVVPPGGTVPVRVSGAQVVERLVHVFKGIPARACSRSGARQRRGPRGSRDSGVSPPTHVFAPAPCLPHPLPAQTAVNAISQSIYQSIGPYPTLFVPHRSRQTGRQARRTGKLPKGLLCAPGCEQTAPKTAGVCVGQRGGGEPGKLLGSRRAQQGAARRGNDSSSGGGSSSGTKTSGSSGSGGSGAAPP